MKGCKDNKGRGPKPFALFAVTAIIAVTAFLLLMALKAFAFEGYPQRIISGMPSITEMLFALGLDDQIVGVTTNCNYPAAALKKEKVGGFFLNLEKVVSLRPDLIVMLEDAQDSDIERLVEHGLPVYTVDPDSVIDVIETIEELGLLTGKEERAEGITRRMMLRIQAVEEKVYGLPRERVLVIVGCKPLIVVGRDNFIDDILNYAGARNLAEQASAAYPQYSFERLLFEDPDYIIVPEGLIGWDEIRKDSRWRTLSAVQNDRILFINDDILSRPGPRVVEAIEEIAEFIHEKKT